MNSPFRNLVPNWLVNYGKHLPTALAANLYYGFPAKKLTVIGVTGTDGKTTTSTMIYHILMKAGYKVALISTVSAKIGTEDIDTGFHVTSPEHFPLQKLLKTITEKGYTHVIIESTSNGLEQFRLWGIHFTVGVVTNITKDHLDYHKNWLSYVKAKGRLFKGTKYAILNREDKSYPYLHKMADGDIITYGASQGDFTLKAIPVKLSVLGGFNRINALAAIAATSKVGVEPAKAMIYLEDFQGVLGRMQAMLEKPFKALVDFAHTPNALLTALSDIQTTTKGRVISVFGCAGLRDRLRREMGKVSAEHADITVITAEDPRTEGVETISREIAGWAQKGGAKEVTIQELLSGEKVNYPVYVQIPNRQKAIDFAVSIAKKGDTVGVFGKGHERSMCFGTEETPWSDQDAVTKSLKKYGYI